MQPYVGLLSEQAATPKWSGRVRSGMIQVMKVSLEAGAALERMERSLAMPHCRMVQVAALLELADGRSARSIAPRSLR